MADQVLVALLELLDPVLEHAPLAALDVRAGREAGTHEDADDQRQEDSRQRGDVIAEVEQAAEA